MVYLWWAKHRAFYNFAGNCFMYGPVANRDSKDSSCFSLRGLYAFLSFFAYMDLFGNASYKRGMEWERIYWMHSQWKKAGKNI